MLWALFFATWVGLTLGLFGGGGSVLSVVVLSLALGMPAKSAMAASLLIIGATSTTALIAQRGSRLLSVRTGLVLGGAGMVGAFVGGRLAAFVPEAVLLSAFGVVMLLTSLAMLGRGPPPPEPGPQLAGEASSTRALRMLAPGLGIGMVTGLLGAGGGFLIVPALVLHGRMPLQRAVPTSLLVVALQSLAGLLGHLNHASLDWAVVVPFTLMATLGSLVGAALAKRTPQELLRRSFAALGLLVAIVVVVRGLAWHAVR